MVLQFFNYKSKMRKIEKRYPTKLEQYKALQRYGETIGLTEHELHYYEIPFDHHALDEELPIIKERIEAHCQVEISKFWKRLTPFLVTLVIISGLIAIALGIIKVAVSTQKWDQYKFRPF